MVRYYNVVKHTLMILGNLLLISGEITHVLHKVETSLLIQLVTCFYYPYSIGNLFSSLLINDVTQSFLLRLTKTNVKNLF